MSVFSGDNQLQELGRSFSRSMAGLTGVALVIFGSMRCNRATIIRSLLLGILCVCR